MTFYSCEERPQAQKATRALPRADERSDIDAGATDLLHRISKHKPRNLGRDEERR